MKRACLVTILALSGCNQPQDKRAEAFARQNDPTIVNPPGRYQMQPGVNPASVAVLDTRYGTVQNCRLVDEHYKCLPQADTSR